MSPVRSIDEDSNETDLAFAAAGVSLRFDVNGRLCTIFLYGPLNADGYEPFAGELPANLQFDAARPEIIQKLGMPTRTGRTSSIIEPGETVWWDRYDSVERCLHLQYRGHDGPLVMVTLMTLDAAP